MPHSTDFKTRLEGKVDEQLKAQRVGYLVGAGSSYLNGDGYPLASQLWDSIKDRITHTGKRDEIQAKIDAPDPVGLEHALDLLDDGTTNGCDHRYFVATAIAENFRQLNPNLDHHAAFVKRLAQRQEPHVQIFNLNYDPLIERAAEREKVRLHDGFAGQEHAYFAPETFEERVVKIRGTYKGKQTDEPIMPLQVVKLHGSIGWYECSTNGIRRCAFESCIPGSTSHLMIPPQHRKTQATMDQPYATLWSIFRGALSQDSNPLNRLVCIGYGFADEHVNTLIESALSRSNFTVLIFTKSLSEEAWNRWSRKPNAVVVTEDRCAIKGKVGPGHPDLWKFEQLAEKV